MAVQISGNDITVPRDTTVTRNLTVGGVLTYEDVTNVDSIGIVTARAGVLVGSGITLSKDGDIFATGVTTSTTFVGALTGNVTGNISGGTVAGSTGTFTGNVSVSGANIKLGDSSSSNDDRLQLGAATNGDLEIFHDGSSSYMDNATGDLYMRNSSGQILIRANTDAYISNYAANEHRAAFKNNGAVELYYDANKKVETHAQGAAIGQVSTIPTMDSFSCQILAGNSGFIGNYHSGSNQQLILGLNQYYQGGYKAPDNNVSQQLQFYNKKFNFLTAPAPGSDNGAVTNTNILTIDDDGVKFGTDTAEANALDDYEEGTFTLHFSVEGQSNMTMTGRVGIYTKIGRTVHIIGGGTVAENPPGGRATNAAIQFTNLPFTSKTLNTGSAGLPFPVNFLNLDSTGLGNMVGSQPYTFVGRLFDNSTAGRIIAYKGDGDQNPQNASLALVYNSQIYVMFSYVTDS